MRNYGTVKATFWTRGSGKALRKDPNARLLALYLMTCSSASMTGIFYLPIVIMTHELGFDMGETERCLTRLADPTIALAYYDLDAELVWVPNLAEHQVGETMKLGDTRRHKLLNELEKYQGHRFVGLFWDRYRVPYNLTPETPLHASANGPLWDAQVPVTRSSPPGPAMPHAMPQSVPHTMPHGMGEGMPQAGGHGCARGEQEQEQEQEQDHGGPHGPSTRPTPVTIAPTPEVIREAQAAGKAARQPAGSRRKAKTMMTETWQPDPKHLEALKNKGLDPQAVVEDFRNYWLMEGKPMADWDACFRNNLIKIDRTDWLQDKFAIQAAEPPTGPRPPTELGPPAPVPSSVAESIRRFRLGQQPALPGSADQPDDPPPPEPERPADAPG